VHCGDLAYFRVWVAQGTRIGMSVFNGGETNTFTSIGN
jgi:hypothetical protein